MRSLHNPGAFGVSLLVDALFLNGVKVQLLGAESASMGMPSACPPAADDLGYLQEGLTFNLQV